MKCSHCNAEIEKDDNFCYKCGHFTALGYEFLKDKNNQKIIARGTSYKQKKRFSNLIVLFFIGTILFLSMFIIRKEDLFKPIIYLKKQINNYQYGYNTSLIKYDNKYEKEKINTYAEAINFIKKDFSTQTWECYTSLEVKKIEDELENKYQIPSIVFCDLSYEKVLKIKKEIEDFYQLFPNISLPITNITYTNLENLNYVVYFQPMYQFVNINQPVSEYNKVNKTQILLNSYYFNEDNNQDLIKVAGNDYYVKDATLETTLIHELGHALSFSLLLKDNNIKNITFETKNNYQTIANIVDKFNQGTYSETIVNKALINYNNKYNKVISLEEYANNISRYAGVKDKNGNIIFDETIAEAIHDYYLHKDKMSNASREIIMVIKELLYEKVY